MAKKEKKEKFSENEIEKKVRELKIEMLKQTTKRKAIKKEIARLLTMENAEKKIARETKIAGHIAKAKAKANVKISDGAKLNAKPKNETKLKGGKN